MPRITVTGSLFMLLLSIIEAVECLLNHDANVNALNCRKKSVLKKLEEEVFL